MNFCLRLRPQRPRRRRPWRNALIATTALTLLLFGAAQLWSAGWAEWGFVLAFMSVWALLSALWSNDDYIEESNLLLAELMDHNFDRLDVRLKQLEAGLEQIHDQETQPSREAA